MKKICCLITVISFVFLFGGCTSKKTLQTTQIITACAAYGESSYTFFVASPKGASEEGGTETTNTSYTFSASNFSDAVESLKKSTHNIDLSHMSIFLTDPSYVSQKFTSDAPYIKQKLKISPLTKVFVSRNTAKEVIDSISSNYSGAVSKYIEAAFPGKKKNALCTMSEMFFSSVNPFYTASIPCISISPENSLPKVESGVFYNSAKGTRSLENQDYNTYADAITRFGKSSKLFNLSYSRNILSVTIDKTFPEREKICMLAQKYQSFDFDILNAVYFSKKCFPSYLSYEKAIGRISVSDIKFK